MATDPVIVPRIRATLGLPEHRTPEFLTRARAIVAAMTGNPNFPSPDPPLATVEAAIAALEAAEVRTLSRTVGTVPERDYARQQLHDLLRTLCSYVQKVADGHTEGAAAIVESAGMHVKRSGARPPRVFAASRGAVSGSVKLVAPSAGKYASYEWAISYDGGKTWELLPPTKQSTAIVTGLRAMTPVHFRYRAVTPKGPTDWSDPIAYFVD
jgi:hypothetical protein